jgi:hypothetical protein
LAKPCGFLNPHHCANPEETKTLGQSATGDPTKTFIFTLHCVGESFAHAWRAEIISAFAHAADKAIFLGKNINTDGATVIGVIKDSNGNVVGKLEIIVG